MPDSVPPDLSSASLFDVAAKTASVDAVSVARVLRRLAEAEGAPWLHGEIARRMADRLGVIRKQPECVIDWWGFVGGGGACLSAVYPKARRVVVEPDERLLTRSARAAARPWWAMSRHRTRVLLEAAVPWAQADLLWANMVLHAQPDAAATLARWKAALAPEGFVMFSTFGPDTLLELREVYRMLGWATPTQSFMDMHDLGDQMVQAGFADPVMDMERLTLTWPSAEQALRELRGLGGNVNAPRHPGLHTTRWRTQLLKTLASKADREGRVAMTFEIVYGHAFQAVPRVPVAQQTQFSVDDMRSMIRQSRRGPA